MRVKFLDRIPLEKREEIVRILDGDPDAVRRVVQRFLLENYYGIDSGYKVQISTN